MVGIGFTLGFIVGVVLTVTLAKTLYFVLLDTPGILPTHGKAAGGKNDVAAKPYDDVQMGLSREEWMEAYNRGVRAGKWVMEHGAKEQRGT